MPKRTDIHRILLIGSGPIVIGQACEFDYSGTQACKALKEEGFEIVLVNSNPATIMTDPELADRTYIEPITVPVLERIIVKERPDAVLPTLGGQTGLNIAVQLAQRGLFDRFGVQVIGASYEAIRKAEERDLFCQSMRRIGLDLPRSGLAHSIDEGTRIVQDIGLPVIIRPSFTLGGTGASVAFNIREFEEQAFRGLKASMINEILIEESVIGWKEFELEVMRDLNDNVVIICSIENFDPMGIHTGDSITVAPAQTLSDKEYQRMRDAAIAVIREIGVETGGSNIQFAINPQDGRMVVIEMNPRVSRSSALASKATGFPIAKMAAKLAVGYTLDEIPNDITKKTPASFEPTIDYCVVKIPRFAFEKFPEADPTLTISMKSVGETMAIGRTFKEALQKGFRSLETGRLGLGGDRNDPFYKNGQNPKASSEKQEEILRKLKTPNAERPFLIKYALQSGITVNEIHEATRIDPWFLTNILEIVQMEAQIVSLRSEMSDLALWSQTFPVRSLQFPRNLLARAKEMGFSDAQIGFLVGVDETAVTRLRQAKGIQAVFKLVDTCGAEFEAHTPYYYSTYEIEDEATVSGRKKVMILGSGPNRIGQGIEFDYCCVHASFALKEMGFETIMVNSNPETVSTDYDTSDKLYFEPLTIEDVLNIVHHERPDGVIVQFGGQTPLNLARRLAASGITIVGTDPENIDQAEDRKRFKRLLERLNLAQPANGTALSVEQARRIAEEIGYPVVVRPSYVLGGRAMEIVYDQDSLDHFMDRAVEASSQHPVLIDRFLENAIEIDVDAVADGTCCVIAGIMEHIEEAGIHSGDSACVIPPFSLGDEEIEEIRNATYALARVLKVVGLINIQFALKDDLLYVLEVNPRASRTVPFVSKATGVPWAKIATTLMVGKTLAELKIREVEIEHVAVKESVLPFSRFTGIDPVLGPEMKSTGEVMGIDDDFGRAFAKSQIAAGQMLPTNGKVFISVMNRDKRSIIMIAKKLVDLQFKIVATRGTSRVLQKNGIHAQPVHKVGHGRPDIIDLIKNGDIALVINTPGGKKPKRDETIIRQQAWIHQIPCITTIPGAYAAVNGIESLKGAGLRVKPIQSYHADRG
jgi:carbamoyl-phosphate synthase large subunit